MLIRLVVQAAEADFGGRVDSSPDAVWNRTGIAPASGIRRPENCNHMFVLYFHENQQVGDRQER